MAKRRLKKVPKASDLKDAAERLRTALTKRAKGELVDVLVEFAREDPKLLRRLDARFELEAPPKELVARRDGPLPTPPTLMSGRSTTILTTTTKPTMR